MRERESSSVLIVVGLAALLLVVIWTSLPPAPAAPPQLPATPGPTATRLPTEQPGTPRGVITQPTRLISRPQVVAGLLGQPPAWRPDISADGRIVLFMYHNQAVVRYDANTGTAQRINPAPRTTAAAIEQYAPAISGDGESVVYFSAGEPDEDLRDACPPGTPGGQPPFCAHLFLRTASGSLLGRVRVGGAWPGSLSTAINADSRFVAFASAWAYEREGVYLYDRIARTVTAISEGDPTDCCSRDNGGRLVDISDDGRLVAFVSDDPDLEGGAENAGPQVYVYDALFKQVQRVSRGPGGVPANGVSGWQRVPNTEGAAETGLALSGDGRHVAFMSTASNLISPLPPACTHWSWAEDNRFNTCRHIYVYDRRLRRTEIVSVSSRGTPADRASQSPAISADGRYVAFLSMASNLVPDVPAECRAWRPACQQVYLHDRETGETVLVSRAADGGWPDGAATGVALSADGRTAVFSSLAGNIVPGAVGNPPLENVYLVDLSQIVGVGGE